MHAPLVYIIILNWNRADDTLTCIESLFQMNYSNKKIVVVDNGSTDDSLTKLEVHPEQINIIANKKNLGFSGGNNRGIEFALASEADYVMLLNNDTIVAPDLLDHLVAAAEEDLELGVVGPSIYYLDNPDKLWFSGMNFPFRIYFIGRHLLVRNSRKKREIVEFISGCGMLIKANVLKTVGLLDETYFMYYEDLDFCLRVKAAGFKLAYIPAAKMWHKVSASSGGKSSPMKQYYQVKSSIFFFRRHVKGSRLLISILLRLVHASLTVFRETMAGRVSRETLKKYFRGVSEALLGNG